MADVLQRSRWQSSVREQRGGRAALTFPSWKEQPRGAALCQEPTVLLIQETALSEGKEIQFHLKKAFCG